MQTFREYLQESLADLAKGKGEPARATYPKTTMKRFADDWNTTLKAWAEHQEDAGRTMKLRDRRGDKMIIDAFENGVLITTAVIETETGPRGKDHLFNFFNHASDRKNPYNNPHANYEDEDWKFEPFSLDNTHHSDQRNIFTQNNPTKTAGTHRQRDGQQSLQDIISSTRS